MSAAGWLAMADDGVAVNDERATSPYAYYSMMIPYRFTIFLLDYEIKFNAIMLQAGKWMSKWAREPEKRNHFCLIERATPMCLIFITFSGPSLCSTEKWLVFAAAQRFRADCVSIWKRLAFGWRVPWAQVRLPIFGPVRRPIDTYLLYWDWVTDPLLQCHHKSHYIMSKQFILLRQYLNCI